MWRLLKQIWIKTNIMCDGSVTGDQSGADKML